MTLPWLLAIGLGILLVAGLWSRLKAPLARMLGGVAPSHKITGGLIAMAVAGIPLVASMLGMFGIRLPFFRPAWSMLGLYGSPVPGFVFGLGYAAYRMGQLESQAPSVHDKPVAEAGMTAPDAAANAVERFNAGMQMAIGAMIALTTGSCTLTVVAYGVDKSPGFALAMLAIGTPLPGAAIWMVVKGNRRLRASSQPGRPTSSQMVHRDD